MKKFLSSLLVAVLMLGATSCLNKDNKDSTSSLLATVFNRVVVSPDSVTVNIKNCKILVNFTKNTFSIASETELNGKKITFLVSDMVYTYDNTKRANAFSGGTVQNVTEGNKVSNVSGFIDIDHSVLHFQYVVNGKMVYASALLPYVKTNTLTYNTALPERDEFTTTKSAYIAFVEAGAKSGKVYITQFAVDGKAAVVPTMSISGLKVKPTAVGYEFTAEKAVGTDSRNVAKSYTFKNFKMIITGQDEVMQLDYDYEGRHVTATGNMFGIVDK